jgi:peptidoglycan/LPS O-acetylase OafA/YrhL
MSPTTHKDATTAPAPLRQAKPRRRMALAVAADVSLLALFAAIGRRSHDGDASPLVDTLTIAAPFVIGYLVAAAALRLDRDPIGVRRGAGVWAVGLALGFLLRGTVFDRGLAPAFILVAIATTACLLVGWRALAARYTPRDASAGG